MPDACREYVTRRLGNSRIENFDIKEAIVADFNAFRALHADRRLGCWVRILYTDQDMVNERMDRERVLAVGGGRLPLIFVNFTFRTEETSDADFAELEARHELRLLHDTYVSKF